MLDRLPISARYVLNCATLQGAKSLRMETRIGSITPSKDADLTILAWPPNQVSPLLDPVQAVVFHGSVANVETVMIAGRVHKFRHQSVRSAPSEHRQAPEIGMRIMAAVGFRPQR
jgi:cytosine/adenosine deaminase-related metal-dependent hydrolase